jgi:hypothetical protein
MRPSRSRASRGRLRRSAAAARGPARGKPPSSTAGPARPSRRACRSRASARVLPPQDRPTPARPCRRTSAGAQASSSFRPPRAWLCCGRRVAAPRPRRRASPRARRASNRPVRRAPRHRARVPAARGSGGSRPRRAGGRVAPRASRPGEPSEVLALRWPPPRDKALARGRFPSPHSGPVSNALLRGGSEPLRARGRRRPFRKPRSPVLRPERAQPPRRPCQSSSEGTTVRSAPSAASPSSPSETASSSASANTSATLVRSPVSRRATPSASSASARTQGSDRRPVARSSSVRAAGRSSRAKARRPAEASSLPARSPSARVSSFGGPSSVREAYARSRWWPRNSSYVPLRSSQSAKPSCRSARRSFGSVA